MVKTIPRWLPGFAAMAVLAFAGASRASDDLPAGVEYFEKHVRPILAEHCLECHGADKTQANLRLDSAEGWLGGGDSGPAVVRGKPDESLLVHAIKHDGSNVEMPPDGKLSDAKIGLIEEWIRRGAPAPKGPRARAAGKAIDLEKGRQFWAYQPLRDASPPSAKGADHPVDAFLHDALARKGLTPTAAASREILIRRLTFALWGMPPTPTEIDAFLSDASPRAAEALVDRLLASPRFGERWARHWFDVVRFAESVTLRGMVFHQAWRYRDYVIDSFNRDRPFDDFIREQIAGDLSPEGSVEQRQARQVATTFLALGNTNLEEQDKRQLDMDVVDEQLDVIGKAFLGQSIGCARCHDHKFDPIPTRDYYALAGILRNSQTLEHANVSNWVETPLPLPPAEDRTYAKREAELKSVTIEIDTIRKRIAKLDPSSRMGSKPRIVAISELPGIIIDDGQAKKVGAWTASTSNKPYIGAGYLHDDNQEKGEKTLTFVASLPRDGRYEVRLAYTPSSNRARNAPVTVFSAEGETTVAVDMRQPPPIEGLFVSLGTYRFESAGQSFVILSNEGTSGHVVADAVQFLPRDDEDVKASKSTKVAASQVELKSAKDALKNREQRAKVLREALAKRPRTMGVIERPQITDCPIHVRGTTLNLGETVPRGFLQVVGPAPASSLPRDQSGRRELSAWIASHQNPLTARVYVNRVWHWLFGKGIVATVDNFGSTGVAPTHPELLDYLALDFIDHGWSTKRLVKLLVLSQAYQRASTSASDPSADPENRYLARMNRVRLDAECLRDALLFVSGQMDLTVGGPTIPSGLAADYGFKKPSQRRSVYVPVLRNALPEIFEAFDFADPSLVVGARNSSSVAPQALFLMNNPLVREQAAAAARRTMDTPNVPTDQRIDGAFRQCVGRRPTPDERRIATETLKNAKTEEAGMTDLYHLLFMSIDFRYCE